MEKFLKFVMARWLARTPLGLIVLGIGWFLTRRRGRQRAQRDQAERTGRRR
ncbi:DUF6203 family protein [Nonomuraea jiangxiensis]|uniref:DUF6203 family protein n=1 Tax=Nonomuraea jiangxiensis TaxID=633440 RepID=UPI0015A0421F|nr:DUF6203 family protein [Nonomuraea jiangxiensis]